jgi:hypothetical protein
MRDREKNAIKYKQIMKGREREKEGEKEVGTFILKCYFCGEIHEEKTINTRILMCIFHYLIN